MYKKIREEIKIEKEYVCKYSYKLSSVIENFRITFFILSSFSDSDTENELKETFRVFSKDNEGNEMRRSNENQFNTLITLYQI